MKKITSVMLILVLILFLSACGISGSNNNSYFNSGSGNNGSNNNNLAGSSGNNNDSNNSGSVNGDNNDNRNGSIGDDSSGSSSGSKITAKVGEAVTLDDIEWLVLSVQDDKALIISLEVLEERPYHTPGGSITWEHSDLRAYLNNDFYNSLSSDFQNLIIETFVINDDNPQYAQDGALGGNDTMDNIFLLSNDEVRLYLPDSTDRMAVDKNGEESEWWLRTPGGNSQSGARVQKNGVIGLLGYAVNCDLGIRPALWINLS
ncbi:MAG: DUF6273 domain-containing protein [Oscillospiraceae bacterium]|nr:DUF6273 domain-containing protein [Oscillospiraceae bacterium]